MGPTKDYLKYLVRYILFVLRESLPHVELSEFSLMGIVPLIIIAAGLGSIAILGVIIQFDEQQWAQWVLGWLAFVVVVVTPTRIGIRYISSLGPELKVEGDPFESNYKGNGTAWGLRTRNSGLKTAYECRAYLEDICFETMFDGISLDRWPRRNLYFTGQNENGFHEIAGGQLAQLNLIYNATSIRDLRGGFYGVMIAYQSSDDERAENHLAFDHAVLMKINLYQRDHNPLFIICRVDVEAINNIFLRDTQPPVTILYTGPDNRHLDEFRVPMQPTPHTQRAQPQGDE